MAHSTKHHSHDSNDGHNDPKTFMAAIQSIASLVYVDDTSFDIPYTAGISRTGWKVYIDRHLPKFFQYGNIVLPVKHGLIIHEWVEWLIETKGGETADHYRDFMYTSTGDRAWKLGTDDTYDYRLAHQLAQHLEKQWVIYNGVDWDAYSAWFDPWIKAAESEQIIACPADLYLQPYENEGDMKALAAIRDAGGPESYMLLDQGVKGGASGAPFYEGT